MADQVTRDDLALFGRPVPMLDIMEGDPAEWDRLSKSETPDATDRLRAAQNLLAWIKWQERRLDKSVESSASTIIKRQEKIRTLEEKIDPNADKQFEDIIAEIVDEDAYKRRYQLANGETVVDHFKRRFIQDCKQLGVDAALRSFVGDPEDFLPLKISGGWAKRTWKSTSMGWKLRFARSEMREFYEASMQREELARLQADLAPQLQRNPTLKAHVEATRAIAQWPQGPVQRRCDQLRMRLATDYVRLRKSDPVRAWILADNWTLGNDCTLWLAERRRLSTTIRGDQQLVERAKNARIWPAVQSARSWMDKIKPWRGRPVDPALVANPKTPRLPNP